MASRFWVTSAGSGTGTWDASTTTHWSASTGGAGGASVPGAGDTVTFDALSCPLGETVTVNTNASVTSLTMGAFTGTLDFSANNNNFTAVSVSISGAGTRTLNMGSGTFTLTNSNGSIWDATTVTGLTLNAGTSTILINANQGNQRQFIGGGKTYNNLTITPVSYTSQVFQQNITGSNTFNNLTISNMQQLGFGGGTTTTISGTLSITTDSSHGMVLDNSHSNTAVATLSLANAAVLNYLSIQDITVSGAGSLTANNSFNAGGNTNVTINPPSGGNIIGS